MSRACTRSEKLVLDSVCGVVRNLKLVIDHEYIRSLDRTFAWCSVMFLCFSIARGNDVGTVSQERLPRDAHVYNTTYLNTLRDL